MILFLILDCCEIVWAESSEAVDVDIERIRWAEDDVAIGVGLVRDELSEE